MTEERDPPPGATGPATDAAPLRAEPFSAARMAVHGRSLAARHQPGAGAGGERLLARLAGNAAVIGAACAGLTLAARAGVHLAPAADCLLDHTYLIEEHIGLARSHLPADYSRQLPCLLDADARGEPRVYALALELVAHGDGRLEPESLARFVAAYQEGAPLALGELWALPIMLRLALIENLRRLAARQDDNRREREAAHRWADRMAAQADARPGDLILLVADMARDVQPMGQGFVADLARRLQGRSGALTQALHWIGTRLADEGRTVDEAVQADVARQAADHASVANTIGSLRLVGTIDWREFVETMSAVEQVLRGDPAGVYGKMAFATRDHYRHVVERLARTSGRSEVEVAAEALALAGTPCAVGDGGFSVAEAARLRHVGYYLAGKGLARLEERLNMQPGPVAALRRAGRRRPLPAYLGAIAAFTALFTAAAVLHAAQGGAGEGLLLAIGVLAALGSSRMALALVDLLAARLVVPAPLPRMDFSAGIPFDAQAIVVVPALLYSRDNVAALAEGLEVRYLANRDPHLRFCLLTDLVDAPLQDMYGDDELVDAARGAIAALNAKYGAQDSEGAHNPFLLLHRRRVWSDGEGAWIGRERKRGKLDDLNAFLRRGERAPFALVEGTTEGLDEIRYVITLDADTQLPRDAARAFVAAMAHPLNHPVLNAAGTRVVDGHGVLQPRVTAALPLEHASRYERLCSGEPGIDPYTRTVSDVYQDVFGEGSFAGKGIYDLDVFERVLKDRFPDDRVLSHDLLEGCYLRCGLLGDAPLVEACPARYSDDVGRRHRWIRGDWQLIGWLRGRVPSRDGRGEANPLPPLARWKLFDNLRRSLVAPVLTALALLCWALLPGPAFWSAAVLSVFFLPFALRALLDLADKPHDIPLPRHLLNWAASARIGLGHALLDMTFLPYEAWTSADAIARTAWRMAVSKRHRLEWRASSLSRSSTDIESTLQNMWFAPMFAVYGAVLLSFTNPLALFAAAPLLLLWFLSPVVAWWVSLPVERSAPQLGDGQRRFLHTVARRTWAFFEDHVTAAENWLPPDNMQEHPAPVVAHRTSPTNLGLALLANVTAWDFGFIATGELLARTGATLATMDRLERWRGHFYKGYDTLTLAPLAPACVSTVDSGNLAGHLLTLAAGLEQLADRPVASSGALDGIRDTLHVVEETAAAAPDDAAVAAAIAALRHQLAPGQCGNLDTLPGLAHCLQALARDAGALQAAVADGADPQLRTWAGKLAAQCDAAYADLLHMAPWMRAVHEFVIDSRLTRIPTLRALAGYGMQGPDDAPALARMVLEGAANAQARLDEIAQLAAQARACAAMDFTFLYDGEAGLLAPGYDVAERRLESGRCDLLASEARLASFVGIAQGQLPQAHWFALGRQRSLVHGEQVLLSWSGSMSEYLMPLLVMPAWRDTLLDETCRGIVRAQAAYGRRRGVPWGISASGCSTVDAAMNYEYRAFGVPGAGARRAPADDLVVAPYATMLALMVEPEPACANLERMAALGFTGAYGFYEAVDYTAARLPRGQACAVVRSFMAHHQGMGFLALSYLLHDRPMQRRFASDAGFQSAFLLLQERVPKAGAQASSRAEAEAVRLPQDAAHLPTRVVSGPGGAGTAANGPEVQLLSNGRYHVMVTAGGGGYSRWHDLALTRWRDDPTTDDGGQFCYLRDLDSGAVWSGAWQPTLAQPDSYEVGFSEGRAAFRRRDHGIELTTEIVVSPEDDIELRRTRLVNTSDTVRTIEVTSYAEVALAPPDDDAAHPAYSKLFVHSEILHDRGAILCTRRPRDADEHPPWLLHCMTVHAGEGAQAHGAHDAYCAAPQFETSRAAFLGRGRGNDRPLALDSRDPLGAAEGTVLDPVVAIRRVLTLAPGQELGVDVVLGAAATRAAALELVDRYRDRHLADRVFELAGTHGQAVLRRLDAGEADAQLYSRLAAAVLYPHAALRADPAVIARNVRGQSGLWSYGISGDLPVVLLQIRDAAHVALARQVVQAHAYWRLKGLVVDLVIWCDARMDDAGEGGLHDQVMSVVAAAAGAQASGQPGGVFVHRLEQIPHEDRVLMESAARVVLSDERGSLADQLHRAGLHKPALPPALVPAAVPQEVPAVPPMAPAPLLDNGIGGFSADGREYLIRTGPGRHTPAPWANVLASPLFGSVVSESGQAYSWNQNAHEFRLTPWYNDPVSDRGGEAFYLRDEHTGVFWSPTALPAPSGGEYLTRHGFGYSAFEHSAHGIHSELLTHVALDAPLKYTVVKLRNDGATARRLSVTGYVEWVLGETRAASALHVVTEQDPASGALFARNPYNTDFSGRVAFFHVNADHVAHTCDRTEFIGRNRSLARPAALERTTLSGRSGAALDPCAALQTVVELQPGETRELVFLLGVGDGSNLDASTVVQRCSDAGAAASDLARVRDYWDDTLGAVRIETPEPAFDLLANGWLMYQTIACRLWARSSYYQSGGAYGFRDQLQDAMATVHARPELLRDHILLFARHQFVEGDVQHWWHPPSGRGLRTHCSDDYLWLPLAVQRYIVVTGDHALLDEIVPFAEGRPLAPGEAYQYDVAGASHEQATLYEHCVRALRRALVFGDHGLPLIGTGDWNDGMDRVGAKGRGESVWLGFFLYDVLQRFAGLAERRADYGFATTCRSAAQVLRHHIEDKAWDGAWYRRAWFDDGTPLGSQQNDECRIDAIAQSWGVLSGAADPDRARAAMEAVDAHLVQRDARLVRLLDPPFDGVLDPGDIRGYAPGVRENGGHYTHAAIWTAMAFAHLGDTARAWELARMINPAARAATPEDCAVYGVEPYVMTADIHAAAPHVGRGGWSWYTGSAGWMYRLIVETLLGIDRRGDVLVLAPRLPAGWEGFRLHYRYHDSVYTIAVRRGEAQELILDGSLQDGNAITLVDDGRPHKVELCLPGHGDAATAAQDTSTACQK